MQEVYHSTVLVLHLLLQGSHPLHHRGAGSIPGGFSQELCITHEPGDGEVVRHSYGPSTGEFSRMKVCEL